MLAFLDSLGPFGWIILVLAIVGLISLPRALREMWTRPWKKKDSDGE